MKKFLVILFLALTTLVNAQFFGGGSTTGNINGTPINAQQSLNATGNVTSWGSTISIGTTALTANATLTLPIISANDVGKQITFVRVDNAAFTITITPSGAGITSVSNLTELNLQNGSITLEAISTSQIRQVNNVAVVWSANGNTVGSLKNIGTKDAFDLPFITNNIERARITSTGLVGINTVTPASSLDVIGSVAYSTTNTAAAAYTAASNDYIIHLTLAGVQTLTLPAASSCNRRVYRIINPTTTVKTISTYTSMYGGTTSTNIYQNSKLEIVSDGTVWRQIEMGNNKLILQATGGITTGVLGGVTFTITSGDPTTLTTSVGMSGYIMSNILTLGAGITMDQWAAGSGSSTNNPLFRGRDWNGATTGSIGITSASYKCTAWGTLTGNGRTFEIKGTGFGSNSIISIEVIN